MDGDPEYEEVVAELAALEEAVDSRAEREQVRAAIEVAREARQRGPFGRTITGFDRADATEALVGSLVVGLPMFVEGGTLEVGAHLAGRPLALAGTVLAGVAAVVGVLYVADIQDVRVQDPLLGVVPRRVLAVFVLAFAAATVAMTAWGRVDWATPGVAAAQVTVAAVPMAVGGALTDIVPGT